MARLYTGSVSQLIQAPSGTHVSGSGFRAVAAVLRAPTKPEGMMPSRVRVGHPCGRTEQRLCGSRAKPVDFRTSQTNEDDFQRVPPLRSIKAENRG